MTVSKLTFIFICSLSSCLKVLGQDGPPPMAMPTDSNVLIVDKIIEVTHHEKYVTDYCSKKVVAYAQQNNWTKDKTDEILGSIKFKFYNSTIYNSYAFYSTRQLIKLLDALTELAEGSKTNETFILTNPVMQNNLDLFVESIIAGKYIVRK
jgi:hypothetical protein